MSYVFIYIKFMGKGGLESYCNYCMFNSFYVMCLIFKFVLVMNMIVNLMFYLQLCNRMCVKIVLKIIVGNFI